MANITVLEIPIGRIKERRERRGTVVITA